MLRRIREPRRRVCAVMAAVVTAAALGFGTSACGGAGSKNADGLGTSGPIAAGHRKPVPVLAGTTLDGARLDLASFKGEVVVMNVWSAWCDPCQAEAPYLERAYEAFKDEGVRFVGVDAHDNTGQAEAFVKARQISYPNLVDGDDEALLTRLAGVVPLGPVPFTFIIDRKGGLAWRALRPVDYKDLSAALGPLIAER